jgi:serine protease Do
MKRIIVAALCVFPLSRAYAGVETGSLLARIGREVEEIAAGVRPSVVQVIAEADAPAAMPGILFPGRPFGRPRGDAGPMRRSGSGFFVDRDGAILTTFHVVRDAGRIVARLDNGAEEEAVLKGVDPEMNVALLALGASRRDPAPLGDSDRLRPGSPVIVVGNPYGLSGSVALGVVGGRGRTVPEIAELAELVQLNASINPGDSGAPVVDARGEVVGILAASMGGMEERENEPAGICFALPVNAVKPALPALEAGREIERGWLGVGIQELTPALQAEFKTADGRGVVVARVIEGSPAADAGVREGDVVRAVNGAAVSSPRELIARVAASPVGSKASISVMRGGAEMTLVARIGRRAAPRPAAAEPPAGRLGLEVEEAGAVSPGGAEEGAVVVRGVRRGSPAARAGLRAGDTILEVNRKKIGGLSELEALVKETPPGGKLLFRTPRGFFVVTPGREPKEAP